jgi:hypothetical protein
MEDESISSSEAVNGVKINYADCEKLKSLKDQIEMIQDKEK